MADIVESKFDQVYRKILNIIKKSIKIWFFCGVLLTGVFYLQKVDSVKSKVPEAVQHVIWDWYVPPSQKR